jgi:integrase
MSKSNHFSFTESKLSTLPSPHHQSRAVYHDCKTPGLTVVVTATGTRSFYFQRRIAGRPEKLFLGRSPAISVAQARKDAAAHNAAVYDGLNPAQVRRAARGELTFGQLFHQYLTEHARAHTKTAKETEANFRRHLLGWQNRKISTIYRADVRKLHADLGKDKGTYTANRVLQLVRAVINWGLHNKLVDRKRLEDAENPAQYVKLFKEEKRDRFLQADEAPLIFRSLVEETNRTIRDYVLVSLLTGARRDNVLTMKWADVNFGSATWRIPDTKSGQPQIVPLSEPAIQILRSRYEMRESHWAFPGEGITGHLVSPKKAWRRILDRAESLDLIGRLTTAKGWTEEQKEAAVTNTRHCLTKTLAALRLQAKEANLDTSRVGLPGLRLHDLRRSLGSWMAATGASLPIIGKSLGHKTTDATLIYARLAVDPVRDAMNRATTALLHAAEGKKADIVPLKSVA